MPSGNRENLKGYGFEERSAEEVRKIASKGGINSGKTRRFKADLAKRVKALGCLPVYADREVDEIMAISEAKGKNLQALDAIGVKVLAMAMSGDVGAARLVAQLCGNVVEDEEAEDGDSDGFNAALGAAAGKVWGDDKA